MRLLISKPFSNWDKDLNKDQKDSNERTRKGGQTQAWILFGVNSQPCSLLATTCAGHALQTVKNLTSDMWRHVEFELGTV